MNGEKTNCFLEFILIRMMNVFHIITNECTRVLGLHVVWTQNLTNIAIENAGLLFAIPSNWQIFKKK